VEIAELIAAVSSVDPERESDVLQMWAATREKRTVTLSTKILDISKDLEAALAISDSALSLDLLGLVLFSRDDSHLKTRDILTDANQ
jgi:hypothetical protein